MIYKRSSVVRVDCNGHEHVLSRCKASLVAGWRDRYRRIADASYTYHRATSKELGEGIEPLELTEEELGDVVEATEATPEEIGEWSGHLATHLVSIDGEPCKDITAEVIEESMTPEEIGGLWFAWVTRLRMSEPEKKRSDEPSSSST